MDGTGFLKTVSFGGFDKKDVLAYVDELNTKIYTLEAELDEKKALLESAGGTGDNSEKYEELLAADKAKITELQTNNDSLKLQMKTMEDDLANKDKEIEALKAQNAELEEQLQEAKNKVASAGDNSAMDLSNVFIEAQKTANTIVTQAKENAHKMDEDAKKLANQVVDDANGRMRFMIDGEVFAYIEYSNPRQLSASVIDYNERYYRNATIFDGEGIERVSTDKAMISYVKSMAIGSRYRAICLDNIYISNVGSADPSFSLSSNTVRSFTFL